MGSVVVATASVVPGRRGGGGVRGLQTLPDPAHPGERVLHADTREALSSLGATSSIVVGGTGAVSDAVKNRLPSAERIAGANRYDTAAKVAEYAAARGCTFGTVRAGDRAPTSPTRSRAGRWRRSTAA